MSHLVYLGLGSNLNNPIQQLSIATAAIAALADVRIMKASASYRNPPLNRDAANNPAQPDYVNKVLAISTTLNPDDLLTSLQAIEIQQGRPREHGHWVSRTIDIDILLYDNVMMDTPYLTIPHPGLTLRAFVVLPLLTIAPDLCLPDGRPLADYRGSFDEDSLHEL